MSDHELIAWMKKVSLTVIKLSKLTKTPDSTIYYWRQGKRRIPGIFIAWKQQWELIEYMNKKFPGDVMRLKELWESKNK